MLGKMCDFAVDILIPPLELDTLPRKMFPKI